MGDPGLGPRKDATGTAKCDRGFPRLFIGRRRLARIDIRQYFDIFGNMNQDELIRALAALAQESRLTVFRLLVQRGPEGFAAGEIGERLAIPGPTLSFHLKELTQAGLVSVRKESRFMYYAANFERMNTLLDCLTENCCNLGSKRAASCAIARPTARRKAV
jgi:ArsR family transcriptional regulator, arsenate/arsenite/antimonite-responsive transcriptional repressor